MNKSNQTKLILESWNSFINESQAINTPKSRHQIFDNLPDSFKNELNVKDIYDGGAWMRGDEWIAEFVNMAINPPSVTQASATKWYNDLIGELAVQEGLGSDIDIASKSMIIGDENSPDNCDPQHHSLCFSTFNNLNVDSNTNFWNIGFWECNGEKVRGAYTSISFSDLDPNALGGRMEIYVILPVSSNISNIDDSSKTEEPLDTQFSNKLGGVWS